MTVTNINKPNLTLSRDIVYNTNNTSLYFNTTTNTIVTSNLVSSEIIFTTTSTSELLVRTFTIPNEIIKTLSNKIIEVNLYIRASPDIYGRLQYIFKIIKNSSNILSSNYSDDINSTSTGIYSTALYTDNLLNYTEGTSDIYELKIFAISTISGKILNISYNNNTFLNITDKYKIGYTNHITNNYLFFDTTGTGIKSYTINTTAGSTFGSNILLSKGIWLIEMFSRYTYVASTYIYITLNYKNSSNFIYDSINYYYNGNVANSSMNIKISTIINITNTYDNIQPFISMINTTINPSITFNTTTTNMVESSFNYSTFVSGYKYTRIG